VAFDGRVQGLGKGVVDDADVGHAVDGQAETDGDIREVVDKVCGSIYGIQDKRWSISDLLVGRVGFLADKEDVGVMSA
jgi:hypothetical protein